MDFVTGFPLSWKKNNAIFVVIDNLSEVAHFFPVKDSISAAQLAELYTARVVSLHGIPKKISSDRGSLFTSKFWKAFQKAIGTTVVFSTAYHPQTSGQVEHVNQILEDMLRACVISFGMKWEEFLTYAEFSYNNSYQASLQAAPFKVLYGRKCRTPLNWSEAGERQLLSPDVVQEAKDRVKMIREHLKAAQPRQKAYYDKRHHGVAFKVGEWAYLRVSPLRGTHRFGIKGKLAPRFVGPFRILKTQGPLAFRLELPDSLSMVHDVFHVSQLKQCFKQPEKAVDLGDIQLSADLSYPQRPVRVLETSERTTRNKTVKFMKLQWAHHSEKEATCEREDHLRSEYPELFHA